MFQKHKIFRAQRKCVDVRNVPLEKKIKACHLPIRDSVVVPKRTVKVKQ